MKKLFRKIKFNISKIFFKKEYKKMIIENFYNSIDKLFSLILKNWKWIFLGIVLLFEFLRKLYLYNAWVPIFVLNSESILNIVSYWFTIIIIFVLFLIIVFFIKIIEYLIVKNSIFFRFLLKFTFFILMIIIIFIVIVSLNKPIWINKDKELIYINDTFEVFDKKDYVEVIDKKNNKKYLCKKNKDYNDNCNLNQN